MRWRPLLWMMLSLLLFMAAAWFWRLGDKWAAEKAGNAAPKTNEPAAAKNPPGPAATVGQPIRLLSGTPALPIIPGPVVSTNQHADRFIFRLSNTTKTLDELSRQDDAILLENALVDTSGRVELAIPDHLRAQGDPGTYIVQARVAVDDAFRRSLAEARAEIVSYIPNNAYLVRVSGASAQWLRTQPQTQAVLRYEPYYKLKGSLLKMAFEQTPMPENTLLNLSLFADDRPGTLARLRDLGVEVLAEARSAFGPVATVRAPEDSLVTIAGLAGVQEIETVRPRVRANDLSRARMRVAADPVAPQNYLGLSGTNIMVNVNDSGVDAEHPDLVNRMFSRFATSLVDPSGHGTHVIGTIMGDGSKSTTVTNASGSIMPGTNGQFRGMAPGARAFILPVEFGTGEQLAAGAPLLSDAELQETAARTNVFISNNSWVYGGFEAQSYDMAAASYDAAVRDCLPYETGSRPMVYVFAAGNSGLGDDSGSSGAADSIQSPGTAKNVITVGAIEQLRNITNVVLVDCVKTNINGTNVTICTTNTPWLLMTDSSDQVAAYSSRGNVGIGLEGVAGRFKPDLVAPGNFVLSTTRRGTNWDQGAYYGTTNHLVSLFKNLFVAPNGLFRNPFFVPDDAVHVTIEVRPNQDSPQPMPDMPIYIRRAGPATQTNADFVVTNRASIPPDSGLSPVGVSWFYAVGNDAPVGVSFDLLVDVTFTNLLAPYFLSLSNLNDSLGEFYRYESGTSMAAANASGTLALMQEFFESWVKRTNSPALMKALLINGARSVGGSYDFQVRSSINFQGWGYINLPSSLPVALSNATTLNSASAALVFDQKPDEALATRDTRLRRVAVSQEARDFSLPMKVTLVWTDPPGNPIASKKLVNDLDLVVTNLDTGAVYYGNDIASGKDFNTPITSNSVPDNVNNVENVFLPGPLGTNYAIVVNGRRVNVNAVYDNTNGIVQDYALVISLGDGTLTNAVTLNLEDQTSANRATVVPMVNTFTGTAGFTGGVLTGQRVGANSPLQGTNMIALPNSGGAMLTIGVTNQWQFYLLNNISNFSNAAFLTFVPPNLAIPRIGVYEPNAEEASRVEADIDLYVSQNPALTNLDPAVLGTAYRSVGRKGTETIILTNAGPGEYYVGIKSEDHEGAEYSFLGVFSESSFGSSDTNGQTLRGFPTPMAIPDGTPGHPGVATIFAVSTEPGMLAKRVVVTNVLHHELLGDLVGLLRQADSGQTVILNNHSPDSTITNRTFIYDDSQERDIFGAQPSDGPGSLHDFAGQQAGTQWSLSEADDAQDHTGYEVAMTLWIERQPDLEDGVTATILPGACREDFVQVPVTATNLTVTVAIQSGSGPLSFQVCPAGELISGCKSTLITGIGASLSIDYADVPPLHGGVYSVRVCNLGANPVTVRIKATIQIGVGLSRVATYSYTNYTPILDNAVTTVTNRITNHFIIASLEVGLRIDHPRISDLAITLIAPDGRRIVLMENRGAYTTNGLGTFGANSYGLLTPVFTNGFESAAVGLYSPAAIFQDWSVLSNFVAVAPDISVLWRSNNLLVLESGAVSNNLPTTNATLFQLDYRVTHSPYLVGMVGWWPFDGDEVDIFGGFDGLLSGDVRWIAGEVFTGFLGDGVATRMVVPACPDLDVGNRPGFSIEGWIKPANRDNTAPLVEWNDVTNGAQGVQFWVGLSNGPGSLTAVLWDTNGSSHTVSTPPLVLTNGGWQHVAFTYDTNTFLGRFYTNGVLVGSAIAVSPTNFVSRTSGDLFFGYHAALTTINTAAWEGGLDEFSVYERALTDCEVALIAGVTNRGKYGTNVLLCPVTNSLALTLTPSLPAVTYANGFSWFTNGLTWETNSLAFENTPGTNPTPIVVWATDPNAAVDDFVLSAWITNTPSALMHFTENTNLTLVPIKFAQFPFVTSNFPPMQVYSNNFSFATQGVYRLGDIILGGTNPPGIGARDWLVTRGQVTVITNNSLGAVGSNCLALARGAVATFLPTTPGHRYELSYLVHGPCAAGWWSGETESYSQRAMDSIGGNHGQFRSGATNPPDSGLVVSPGRMNAMFFPGMIDFTNNVASKIELGDPDNLKFTNSFTIEGWIKPIPQTNVDVLAVLGSGSALFQQIFFRGDWRHCLDPYYLALEQVGPNLFDLEFHIENANARDCGMALEAELPDIQVNEWNHVAAVFEYHAFWTNNPPWPTNELRLYLNGIRLTNVFVESASGAEIAGGGFTDRAPFRDLDPGYRPSVSIGNRTRYDAYNPAGGLLDDNALPGSSEPFRGFIDDLTVYGRALTDPEIAAIANAGAAGKADTSVPPDVSLAKVRVSLGASQVDIGYGDNSRWVKRQVTFTAEVTNTLLRLEGLLPGTLVDQITLTEMPAELNYLPEEYLSVLNGSDAYGDWRLEMWDTRTGATNGAALLEWTLTFVLVPSNAPPVITLVNGMPYTNTIPPGGVQNFVVPIPQWATNATNVLLSATEYRTGNPATVGVLFDQTNRYPTALANALFWPPLGNGTNVLSTNSTSVPQLAIGPQYYYLSVTNTNSFSVTFGLGVWFDIMTLTNCVSQTNFISLAGIPRYFQFDIPTNALLPDTEIQQATVLVNGARSNLTVVLGQHLPLPDLRHYDYIGRQPATNNQILMVLTNTTPFSIQTNRWYVGVFSSSATNVPFTIEMCYATNSLTIIKLTNAVPFVADLTNLFVAPPGPPRRFFFEFDITNSVSAVLFELYNLTGDADLVLSQDWPPGMAPYLDGSYRLGRNPEQIVLRPHFALPDLRGRWFLGIYNNEAFNVAYALHAITASGGLLQSTQALQVTLGTLPPPHGLLLGWNSVEGEWYLVEYTTSLRPPVVWLPYGPAIRATTPLTTLEVTRTGSRFYRVTQVLPGTIVNPQLTINFVPGGLLRISWPITFPGYTLQYSYTLNGPWVDANLPVTVEGNEFVVYDPLGPQPKYYRLVPP